jgi:hypothetical protein
MNDQPMVPESASEVRDIDPAGARPKPSKKSDPKKILIIGAAVFVGLIALVALAFMASTMMGNKSKGNMVAPQHPIDVPAASSTPDIPRRASESSTIPPSANTAPVEKNEIATQQVEPNGTSAQASSAQASSAQAAYSAPQNSQPAAATTVQDYGPAIVKIQTQIDELTTSVNSLRSVVEQSLENTKAAQSVSAARSAVRVRRPAREDNLRPTNEGGITQLRPAKNAHLNTMIGNRAWITVGTNEYALTVGESLPDGRTVTDINTQDRIVSLSDGSYVSGE